MPDEEDLASVVKRARKARGWSAEALSQQAGVSYRTISRIESGKTQEPKDATIIALAEALELEPQILAPVQSAYEPPVTPTQAALDRIESMLQTLLDTLTVPPADDYPKPEGELARRISDDHSTDQDQSEAPTQRVGDAHASSHG